ncbi:AAA family ATPase [Moorellaceae bacterium AZ2]
MRILLTGQAGAGKDTVAGYLVTRHNFRRYAFADKIKQIAMELWPEEFRKGKPRRLLQRLGSKMREIDSLVWVHYIFRQIEKDSPERVVITDGRLEDEHNACRMAGFWVVEVRCSPELRAERLRTRDGAVLSAAETAHETERWACPQADFNLDNNGTIEGLYRQVDNLIKVLQEKS